MSHPRLRCLRALILRDLGTMVRTPVAFPIGAAFVVGMSLWCTDAISSAAWGDAPVFTLTLVLGIGALWSTTTMGINTVVQERTRGCYATLRTAGVSPRAFFAAKVVAIWIMTFCLSWLGCVASALSPLTSLAIALWMALGALPFALIGVACGAIIKSSASSSAPILVLSLITQVVAISYAWPRIAPYIWVSPMALGQIGGSNLAQGLLPWEGTGFWGLVWLAWLITSAALLAWAVRRYASDSPWEKTPA